MATGAIVANAGVVELAAGTLELGAGDVLRATAYAQLTYPTAFAMGVSCVAQLRLLDPAGREVAASPLTQKYVTAMLEVLPLRAELLRELEAPAPGPHRVVFEASCSREAASPTVGVVGGGTTVLVERFAPVASP